jgi:hypothetical protein
MFTPTLDWVSNHDERSRNYSIAEKVGTVEPKKKYWTSGVVLDQGREGACVGFGWTGELLASPMPFRTDDTQANEFALSVYRRAQQLDQWAGENYSGTSVLAGAKVMKEKGYISGYRWAFNMDDLRSAVISEGPVVIGVPWKDGMYETRPSGLVDISGEPIGGHCLFLTGYNPRARLKGEKANLEVYRWRNSWGLGYGVNGNGFIKAEDLATLLKATGEACVPQGRTKVRF